MPKQEKPKAIVTPAGVAKYASISKPKLNFNKTGEEYSVEMQFDPADVEGLTEQFTALAEKARKEAVEKAKNGREAKLIADYGVHLPISEELDKDSGDPTGKMLLKAKNSASYKDKNGEEQKRKLPVFDAKGKPTAGLNIGRGSTLKVSVVPNTFVNPATKMVGVSLWLKAVQVINLVEYGGGDAKSFGFGEEEGFVVNEDAPLESAAADNNDEF